MTIALRPALALCFAAACRPTGSDPKSAPPTTPPATTVATQPTAARAPNGAFISWREHVIDDREVGRAPIAGGDGLAMADLDGDDRLDIVSVHESDTQYDGVEQGHVRLAFGTDTPDRWVLATLGDGAEAAAAEDVAIGDMNGDGHPDVVVACELAHLVYFQNPGKAAARHAKWPRVIPPLTQHRGSFIRVALADFDGDRRLDVLAANKGVQNPTPEDRAPKPISIFRVVGDPLDGNAWTEQVLAEVPVPINARPVDLDADGDLDVVAGSMLEERILWLENREAAFVQHAIDVAGSALAEPRARVSGFSLAFADLDRDRRVDIVLTEGESHLVWLAHPDDASAPWTLHPIGDIAPDLLVGIALADLDGDGGPDVMVGGYSRGPRDRDGDVGPNDMLGRLAWFQHPDDPAGAWTRHDVSRRKRGMFDGFVAQDLDADGDLDLVGTRGNSAPYDGVFWLEQVRTKDPAPAFVRAREHDSEEAPLP